MKGMYDIVWTQTQGPYNETTLMRTIVNMEKQTSVTINSFDLVRNCSVTQ